MSTLGFRPDRVLTLRVPLPERKYPDPARRVLFFDELLRGSRRVPGVTAAAVNTGAHPFGSGGWRVEVPGSTADDRPLVMHQVSADYTKALGIPLLKGRLFRAPRSRAAGRSRWSIRPSNARGSTAATPWDGSSASRA